MYNSEGILLLAPCLKLQYLLKWFNFDVLKGAL